MASTDPSDLQTRTAVLEHRADATDRALDSLRHDVNQGFAGLRREVNERFDRMDQRLDHMDQRLHHAGDRMDQHLRWVITTVITTAVAIVGANGGILTLLLRAR